MPAPVSETDLHAYVDGALEPGRRAEVESFLADNAEAARRVRAYAAQNGLLHELFDHGLRAPLPAGTTALQQRLERRLARPGAGVGGANDNGRRLALQAAAATLLLVIGGGGGFLAGRGGEPAPEADGRLPVEAMWAEHQSFSAALEDVAFDREGAASDPVGWLAEAGHAAAAAAAGPKLDQLDYRLLGSRTLEADERPAAQFLYENPAGRRLTLLVGMAETAPSISVSYYRADGLSVLSWTDAGVDYALVGEIDPAALPRLASSVFQTLDPAAAPSGPP